MLLPFQLQTTQDIKKHIKERFKRLRVELNLSRARLAARADVAAATIQRFEEIGEIGLGNLIALAKALDAEKEFFELFPEPVTGSIKQAQQKAKRRIRPRIKKQRDE